MIPDYFDNVSIEKQYFGILSINLETVGMDPLRVLSLLAPKSDLRKNLRKSPLHQCPTEATRSSAIPRANPTEKHPIAATTGLHQRRKMQSPHR